MPIVACQPGHHLNVLVIATPPFVESLHASITCTPYVEKRRKLDCIGKALEVVSRLQVVLLVKEADRKKETEDLVCPTATKGMSHKEKHATCLFL